MNTKNVLISLKSAPSSHSDELAGSFVVEIKILCGRLSKLIYSFKTCYINSSSHGYASTAENKTVPLPSMPVILQETLNQFTAKQQQQQ